MRAGPGSPGSLGWLPKKTDAEGASVVSPTSVRFIDPDPILDTSATRFDWQLWPAVFLPGICEAALMPHIPKLMRDFFDLSSAAASENLGYVDSVAALLAFLSAGAIGQMSDSVGRKPLLILGAVGYLLPNLCLAVSSNLWFYLVARALRGLLMGSSSASGPTNTLATVVADRCESAERSVRFGHIYAVACCAQLFSPLMGHLDEIGVTNSILFDGIAGVAGLNLLYVTFVITESNPPQNRLPVSSNFRMANPLLGLRLLWGNPALRCLGFIAFFSFLPESGILDASLFYLKDKLDFTPHLFSWLFFGFGVAGFLSQTVVLTLLRKHWNVHDVTLLQVALALAAAHFMVYALSVKVWMPFIAIGLCAVYLISSPAINGIVSAQVSKHNQGQALGALASIKALCAVFGPLMFTQLYAHFQGGDKCSHPCVMDCKEMPFYVSTGLESIGVAAALFWLPKVINQSEHMQFMQPAGAKAKQDEHVVDSSSLLDPSVSEIAGDSELGALPRLGDSHKEP